MLTYITDIMPVCARNVVACAPTCFRYVRQFSAVHRPLVRTSEFIFDALYNPDYGYFSKVDVIASPPAAIKFGDLLGKAEYQQTIARLYADHPTGWSTPAEVFAPFYSQAIARYLLQWLASQRAVHNPKLPLTVYELGGGMGNNARHICDFIRGSAPGVYRHMSYTILEISPRLSAVQAQALTEHACARSVVVDGMALGSVAQGMQAGNRSALHATPRPAGARASGQAGAAATKHVSQLLALPDPNPCVVIGLEVLDNLPHDKVVCLRDGQPGRANGPTGHGAVGQAPQGMSLCETFVRSVGQGQDGKTTFEEVYEPIDPTSPTQAVLDALAIDRATGAVDHETGSSTGGQLKVLAQALAGGNAAYGDSWTARLSRRLPWSPAKLMPPAPDGLVWARYVPTGAYRLAQSLQAALPKHHLLLADFTHLPPPKVDKGTAESDSIVLRYAPGASAPLVASKSSAAGGAVGAGAVSGQARTVDHATYMSAPLGTADIFFPTDFRALAKLVDAVKGKSSGNAVTGAGQAQAAAAHPTGAASTASTAKIQSQAAFLKKFAEVGRTMTVLGYNPMLEDYPNTAVLTT